MPRHRSYRPVEDHTRDGLVYELVGDSTVRVTSRNGPRVFTAVLPRVGATWIKAAAHAATALHLADEVAWEVASEVWRLLERTGR